MQSGKNISAVVAGRVCCGCGACAVICPKGAIGIVEGYNYNFAQVDSAKCVACGKCSAVCPSAWIVAGRRQLPENARESGAAPRKIGTVPIFPPFLVAWAANGESRREGASGGFVTALVTGLLESGEIDGAVMVRGDGGRPLYNRAVVARTPAEIAACRGSRYAPASACLGLAEVMRGAGRYAFVGKGCEVTALRRMQEVESTLRDRITLAVGIFCAQTPARARTEEFLKTHGVNAGDVDEIRYRGAGWPGRFVVRGKGRTVCETPYAEAWGFLAGGLPAVRCFLCSDGMAAEADISAGDPWGMKGGEGDGSGKSLVIVRTEAGKRALSSASSAVVTEEATGDWIERRLAAQGRREESAARRTAGYRAIFGGRVIEWLSSGKFEGVRTLVRQRLRRTYY